ncbi:unnamed protein product [Cylindrotheca closterium]|uniref:VWFD domain-containing protein n=1 Tax=Cylindrotheca closterium TaxID=2856 RepID=A0AAD2FSH1_9STRA|nr:unnamed protein product [Cylindrotheca closterium]
MKLSVLTLLFTVVLAKANGDADAVDQGDRHLSVRANQCTIGDDCCFNGIDVCNRNGLNGIFEVGSQSCQGERSCVSGGRVAGSELKVGAGSCIGQGLKERACALAGSKGKVEIGDGSCVGDRTCNQMGRDGTATVGDGSCLGYQSCFHVAREDGEVHIGDNSCTKNRSCRAVGKTAVEGLENGSITIGNGSCNCIGCCGCLKPGDTVGDGVCNSFGDGEDNCCLESGDRNPFGPLSDNILCFDQRTQCRKATVSGDPHIRTFSGTAYDCMGQGEFILTKSISETDPLEIRGLFVDPQFTGQANPWENDKSPQTVTRGVSFIVDEDVPRVKIMTDDINVADQACGLHFYVDDAEVSRDQMLDGSLFGNDVKVTSEGQYDMRFKFHDYEADLTVLVSSVSRKWGCVISFSSCLKEEYHGDVIGLFGTNNAYKDDDWTTPGGEQLVIPTNPKKRGSRGAATDFCLGHYCFQGDVADSFFGADYTYYSRCDISPYEGSYDEDAFEQMLATITAACDEAELDINIPSNGLYDAALDLHLRDADYNECPVDVIEEVIRNNEIATFNCERTPERTEIGTGGDPHFTTWKNEHFEYHGQCDLTLVSDEDFAGGLGLDIQIRTKVVRFWSYIKNVAIKIGNDILEIEGSADAGDAEAHYWINYEYQGDLDSVAGYPVTQELPSVYKRKYIIDLSSKYPGASISVKIYKEFLRVQFSGDESAFGNTVGLLGNFKNGKTLARDGVTEIHDFSDLGDEWQVLPSEPKLFREASFPQFPERCIKPEDPRGDRARRLGESNITMEEAEAACSSLNDELSIKDCVYDILATQDLGMVGAF